MKFLQAAVLSAICVGYVTASHLGYVSYLISLRDAIDEGKLDIAVYLVKQDEKLCRFGVDYVIIKGDPDFIVNFVNQTNQVNARTLNELWYKSSIETFEKVLEKVDFPQQALVDFEASHGVVYRPEKFLVLLNKIVKPEDQEKAVEKGIEQLVSNCIEPSPLLNALKGKTFRSERLEHFAIQKAFMIGVKHGIVDRLPEGICSHAAITPELYADALNVMAELWEYNSMRIFLLEQADLYDLETVKEKAGYADLNPAFRGAIERALGKAAPGGTRTRAYDIQTVKKAEETFNELGHPGISEDVFNIIGDSVALGAPTRRGSLAIQKAFMEGIVNGIVNHLPEDICNHAAITPELYAKALIETAGWAKYDMHQFLLKQADRYDLQAVKENAGYAGLNPEFRDAIEKALGEAAPGGTRTRAYDIQTVVEAEETFNELGSSGISEDPLSIVGDFVALDAPARREGQTASKKAPKKVVSDVTSTPTKTEGSEGIGSGRVDGD